MDGSHLEATGCIPASEGMTTGAFVGEALGWSVRIFASKNTKKTIFIQIVNMKSSRFSIIVGNLL